MLKNKKNAIFVLFVILIPLMFIQTSNKIQPVSSAVEITEDYNDSITAYDLFKQDPTNPTQILKQEIRDETENLISLSNNEERSQAELMDTEGQQTQFKIVESFLTYPYNYITITATLQKAGAHCYIYVQNGLTPVISPQTWHDAFENNIYPNNIQYFGNPDGTLGDIDSDSKVTVLVSSMDGGVAGYFNPINEYTQATYPNSNEREMVYISHDYGPGLGVLAHEFEHLIHFNYDSDEFLWVDEGCAEYAKFVNGYYPSHNRSEFLSYFELNPDDSLLYWNYDSEGGKDVRIDYGSAYAFIFYVAEKYGDAAIKNIVSDTDTSGTGVEDSLQGLGHSIDFNDLYLNWITALIVDDPSFGGGLYGFVNMEINLNLDSNIFAYPAYKTDIDHRYYGIYGVKLTSPPDYFKYTATGLASFSLGTSIAFHDDDGWHVNQSIDSGDVLRFLNGTLIDTAYVISSIMESVTPAIPASNQVGLGYTDKIDYAIEPGQPLIISSIFTLNYVTSTWSFSLSDIYIEDNNGTEINETSGVDVYVQFQYQSTSDIYEIFALSYSVIDLWNIAVSLQSFDEEIFVVSVIGTGSQQYGKRNLGTINVEHILSVEKPSVILLTDVSLTVTVNASYTQLNSWSVFSEDVETSIILYDSNGDVQTATPIDFNPVTNNWESGAVDFSSFNGEHYIKVSFKYAGRTVRSPESDRFTLEGEPPTTNGVSSSFWVGFAAVLSILMIPIVRKRRAK